MSEFKTHTISDLTEENRCIEFFFNQGTPISAFIMAEKTLVTVGDAMVIRDELLEEGFVLGQDFAIRKV